MNIKTEPKDKKQPNEDRNVPRQTTPKVTIEPGFNAYKTMVVIHQSTMTRSLDLLQEYDMLSQHTTKITPGLVIKLKKMTLDDATTWLEENMPQNKQPKVRRTLKERDDILTMSLLVHSFATTEDDKRSYPFMALLDSKCTLSAIDKGYVQKHKLRTYKYDNPIRLFLSDGLEPKSGQITDFIEMQIRIGNHQEFIHLAVLDLVKMDIFLSYDWLKLHNPEIDWTKNEIGFTRCLSGCGQPHAVRTTPFKTVVWQQPSWFRAYMTKSTQLVLEATKGQKDKTFEELVPERYQKFQDVFKPTAFDELLARKPWDHAINLKPDAPDHSDCKLYPMPLEERWKLNKFFEENLQTG
jgi:Retroviral aspartyl protease